jgi:hypothetical protein
MAWRLGQAEFLHLRASDLEEAFNRMKSSHFSWPLRMALGSVFLVQQRLAHGR